MLDMMQVLQELYDYLVLQFIQILPYWLLGAAAGACVTAFAGEGIGHALARLGGEGLLPLKLTLAAILGISSPLCMFGTIPLIYSFGQKGIPQHLLAAFMVSSILLNPNLFMFSFALGIPVALLRLFLCLLAGILAGLLVKCLYKKAPVFNFDKYVLRNKAKPEMKKIIRALHEFNNTIVKTAPYILIGIALAALFDEFVSDEVFRALFAGNTGFGVLLAAGLGVPVYVCGGGTIPLIAGMMDAGMSLGSASAFMVTGPATKFSNLSAVKIILGTKNFILYIVYIIIFAVLSGYAIDIIHSIIR
jgi:uncharacterized membrane protein YraQ (UPF0718 family)